jgi:hypothetical protein
MDEIPVGGGELRLVVPEIAVFDGVKQDVIGFPPKHTAITAHVGGMMGLYFAKKLVGPNRDVLTNEERSVTGSVETMLVLVDALRGREPAWPLAEMNERALGRSRMRAPVSRFKEPERYRVDVPSR